MAPRCRPGIVRPPRITRSLALLGVALLTSLAVSGVASVSSANAGTDDYPTSIAGCHYTNNPGGASFTCDLKDSAQDSLIDPWGEYNRECTSFVAWRLHYSNGFEMPFHDNAYLWKSDAQNRGYTVDTNPALGAVAWWGQSTQHPYGHVAWVESISGSNVTVEQYNATSKGTYSEQTLAASSVDGYIHFSDLANGGGRSPVPWNFENLDGDPGSLGGHDYNLGQTPAEVNFDGVLQVFYSDASEGYMRHAWADSSGWHFDVLDGAGGSSGRITANVGGSPSVVVYNHSLQLFYYDYTNHALRHAWSSDGTTWNFETLDGATSSYSGHSSADVGRTPSAVVYGTSLQLFYLDNTNGVLRHAWSANGTFWNFENLDGGSGSVSGYTASVGSDPTAVSYSGTLQVFYYDSSYGNLRHAWSNSTGWHFENLDGDPGSIGKDDADVGYNPAAVVYGSTLQVFYYDATNGNLRHAWSDSNGWHFETLDGDPGSIGKNNANLGLTPNATVLSTSSGTSLQVFYYDKTNGNLQHAWSDSSGWHFETLDGSGGSPAGRENADVGYDPVAIQYGNAVQLFYYDNSYGNLRHSWSQ